MRWQIDFKSHIPLVEEVVKELKGKKMNGCFSNTTFPNHWRFHFAMHQRFLSAAFGLLDICKVVAID